MGGRMDGWMAGEKTPDDRERACLFVCLDGCDGGWRWGGGGVGRCLSSLHCTECIACMPCIDQFKPACLGVSQSVPPSLQKPSKHDKTQSINTRTRDSRQTDRQTDRKE
mmetsp:Transcript_36822/g.92289  ORF Transcript_36822/g.92289 Transcript_36822/m.92289 type:complete len:109 (+) Transcript_36822:1878-2204(+)